MLSEKLKFVKGLAPAADRFNTNPASDVISMANAEAITFLVYHDGGTTGKAKITVLACDDFTPSNTTAIPFRYRKLTTGAADAIGAITAATAADGVETTPAESTIFEIHVKASELPAGKPNIELLLTETANDPVNACVIAILEGLRYGGISQPTAIA